MVIKTEVILDINSSVGRKNKESSSSSLFNLKMSENQKLIGCCIGIFVCYFYYGILQEKMWVYFFGSFFVIFILLCNDQLVIKSSRFARQYYYKIWCLVRLQLFFLFVLFFSTFEFYYSQIPKQSNTKI